MISDKTRAVTFANGEGPINGWRALFPPAQWLAAYRPQRLAGDAVAGVTLAAYAIPVSLAYASLAGFPPQNGIYCYLLSGLLYALFGTSRQLAVKGLINVPESRQLWRVSRFAFGIAMVAFVGVLLLGILNGVMLAAVVSLLMLGRRAARPHAAFLGRIPGTWRYSDLERNPDNEVVPGVLIFRVESGLLYFNVEHVRQVVWQNSRAATVPSKLVVCDLFTSPYVDVAGARMLARLHEELAAAGIQFQVVEVRATVRDILRAEGLEERLGQISRRMSVDDIVETSRQHTEPRAQIT